LLHWGPVSQNNDLKASKFHEDNNYKKIVISNILTPPNRHSSQYLHIKIIITVHMHVYSIRISPLLLSLLHRIFQSLEVEDQCKQTYKREGNYVHMAEKCKYKRRRGGAPCKYISLPICPQMIALRWSLKTVLL
jgi:hypothetical protein